MLRHTRTAAHPIVVKIIRPQRLELASIKGGRDITRPYFGKMLELLDSVLAGQGRDYQVYEELLKDSQVHSCFQQLSDRISECETTVLPGGERPIDLAAAEAFELVLKAIGWDEITKRMAYARIFGFSVAEVLWGVGGTIECIKVRAQRRFKFDEDLNLRLLTMTNSYEGELLPDRKFWHLSMGGWRSDEPYGLGLGHQLYWPVYFKKNGVLSWLRFLEKYGHPLPLVRHAEGATDDQKREAIYLAQSLAEDSAAAGSENLTFDLIESSRNGTADYTQLVQTMDAQIAKIILSQGMTTDNGSSRAQADVHNGVADSIVKSLSDLICESFNKSIVTWWTEFNFPGAKPPQVWRRTEPESDLVAIVARDKTLWEMGFPPTAEYIVETYGEGFRPPERGEDAPIALNGAQVTALTTTISQAISDGWIPELAVATIRASFPTIGADLITAIAEQLQAQVDKSAELVKPQEAIVPPDVAAAMFAETLDYAGKKGGKGKKNCEKGKICRGSCISKKKTCLGDMNPEQLKAHKAAQKAAKKTKGGGGGSTDPVADPKAVPVVKADNAKPIAKNDIPDAVKETIAAKVDAAKTIATENPKGKHTDIPLDPKNGQGALPKNSPTVQYFDKFADKETTGKDIYDGIRSFTGPNYKKIREYEKNGNSYIKPGSKEYKELKQKFEEGGSDSYFGFERSPKGFKQYLQYKKAQYKPIEKASKSLNTYLDKAPRYNGGIHRGLTFSNKADLDQFLARVNEKSGIDLNAMSSFSSAKSVAKKFDGGEFGVMMSVKKNKSGVTVKNASIYPKESEVLVKKGTTYKILGEPRMTKDSKGNTLVEIDLQEG